MKTQKENDREKMRKQCAIIFQNTYDLCQKLTVLSESINQSIKLTKLYLEGYKFYINDKIIKSKEYNIIITPHRTLEAVQKYYIPNLKNLNFASAKHPGGGVWSGARSQEESLCRSSTLYLCLISDQSFPPVNFLRADFFDFPQLPSRESDDNVLAELLYEKDWYNIDVISCAAHNQKAYKLDYEKLKKINYIKIKAIIECAIENNIDDLILGAFGCGGFANPPQLISKIFKKIFIDEEYYKYFENVHFDIFTTLNEAHNLNEFQNTFEKYIKKK